MEISNRVLFPLRSNIGWFQSLDLQKEIENRIKEAILIYDEIYIEDGTYQAWILDNGKFEIYNPPGTFPNEDRKIEYERHFALSQFTMAIKPSEAKHGHVMMQGKPIARFKIDYSSIFKNIDTSSHPFLNLILSPDRLDTAIKSVISRQSDIDKRVFSDLHPNIFYRNLVIDNINKDIVSSILLKSSIVLDERHGDLLSRKCMLPKPLLKSLPVGEEIAIRHLLSIAVPHFSDYSIEQVINLREDETWSTFRRFISEIISSIKIDPQNLIDPGQLEKLIQKKINQEVFAAIEKKYTSEGKLAIDLGLGFMSLIPSCGAIATVADMGKSIYEYLKDKSAWYAFLLRMKSR